MGGALEQGSDEPVVAHDPAAQDALRLLPRPRWAVRLFPPAIPSLGSMAAPRCPCLAPDCTLTGWPWPRPDAVGVAAASATEMPAKPRPHSVKAQASFGPASGHRPRSPVSADLFSRRGPWRRATSLPVRLHHAPRQRGARSSTLRWSYGRGIHPWSPSHASEHGSGFPGRLVFYHMLDEGRRGDVGPSASRLGVLPRLRGALRTQAESFRLHSSRGNSTMILGRAGQRDRPGTRWGMSSDAQELNVTKKEDTRP